MYIGTYTIIGHIRIHGENEYRFLLDVSQPRISDLQRGKIQLFTIDILVNMLAKLGKPVVVVIDNRIAA